MQRFLKKKGSKLGSGRAKKSYYVTRDKKGRIKKWTSVGSSQKADRRGTAKYSPRKKKQGNQGDYRSPKRGFRIF